MLGKNLRLVGPDFSEVLSTCISHGLPWELWELSTSENSRPVGWEVNVCEERGNERGIDYFSPLETKMSWDVTEGKICD